MNALRCPIFEENTDRQLIRPLTEEEHKKLDELWDQMEQESLGEYPTLEQVEEVYRVWENEGPEGLLKLFRARQVAQRAASSFAHGG